MKHSLTNSDTKTQRARRINEANSVGNQLTERSCSLDALTQLPSPKLSCTQIRAPDVAINNAAKIHIPAGGFDS